MLTVLSAVNDHTDVYVATLGQIVITIIATAGATAAAVIAAGIPGRKRSRKKQNEIHEQVVNTHDTNFRVDVDKIATQQNHTDSKIDDVLAVLKKLVTRQDRTSGDVGRIKNDVAAAVEQIAALNERLDNHIDGR